MRCARAPFERKQQFLVFSCKSELQIANMMFIGLNKQPEVQLTLVV